MTELLFTADGLLREHALGASPRILARVVEEPGGRLRLLAAEHEYEIVPSSQSGWALELREARGEPSGGFQPFRLRCGGRLRVGEVGMSLHGRPWSHEGWAFSLPDGRRVEATVANLAGITRNGDGAAAPAEGATQARGVIGVTKADQTPFVVVLEAAASLQVLALAEILALGSWLIARWHSTPTADHVLASAGEGTDLASSSKTLATAGIPADTAN
jgi:hypothetical protein